MSLVTEQMNRRLQDKLKAAREEAVDAQRGDPDDWGRWMAMSMREYGMLSFSADPKTEGVRATLLRAQVDERDGEKKVATRQLFGIGWTVGAAMVALRKEKRRFDSVQDYAKLKYKKRMVKAGNPEDWEAGQKGNPEWVAEGLVNVRNAYSEENTECLSTITIRKGGKLGWELSIVAKATGLMYVRHMHFAKLPEAKVAAERHRNLREYDRGFETLD